MNVILEGVKQECGITWDFNGSFKANTKFDTLIIQTYPNCSLQSNAQVFIVKFNEPKYIIDNGNNHLLTPVLTVRSFRFIYISPGEAAALEATGSAFSGSSLLTFALMLGISMLQSAAIGSFWAFVNMVQILAYLPVISVEIPTNLEIFLTQYLTVNKMVFPFKLLPNIPYNPLNYLWVFITKPLNDRFILSGYETLSFIMNFSEELLTWIMLFFFYLLLKVLTAIIPKTTYFSIVKYMKRCETIHKWREDYEYNAIIRILIECYLNMIFCAILNIWNVFSSYFIKIIDGI